jgi:hypothetical protein
MAAREEGSLVVMSAAGASVPADRISRLSNKFQQQGADDVVGSSDDG